MRIHTYLVYSDASPPIRFVGSFLCKAYNKSFPCQYDSLATDISIRISVHYGIDLVMTCTHNKIVVIALT